MERNAFTSWRILKTSAPSAAAAEAAATAAETAAAGGKMLHKLNINNGSNISACFSSAQDADEDALADSRNENETKWSLAGKWSGEVEREKRRPAAVQQMKFGWLAVAAGWLPWNLCAKRGNGEQGRVEWGAQELLLVCLFNEFASACKLQCGQHYQVTLTKYGIYVRAEASFIAPFPFQTLFNDHTNYVYVFSVTVLLLFFYVVIARHFQLLLIKF